MFRLTFKGFFYYFLFFLALKANAYQWDSVSKQYYVEDRLLIKTKKTVNENELSKILSANNTSEDSEHEKKHPGLRKSLRLRGLKMSSSNFESTLKKLQALAADKNNPHIESVERDWIAKPSVTSLDPNDPYYKTIQWHHSSIDTPGAWAINTGSNNIIIAIVDTGIDLSHPDLSSKILPGYNFFANNNNPIDENGHGTAVSGTAAALTNNGIGVAGVSWNSKILPVRISDPTGSATYSAMAQGIIYAADNGARVINISFGGASSSTTLQDAINYAWSKNAVIVAAAGNDSGNGYRGPVSFPAACDHVLGISAIQLGDTLASFSNYGKEIDLAAPGDNIYTTYATNMGAAYKDMSGTSFSSPIVAGVAALILSKNPKLTNTDVVNILENNTNDLGSAGFDTSFGYGKVNAYKALSATPIDSTTTDKTPPTVSISNPVDGSSVTGTITVTAAASDNAGISKVELLVDNAVYSTTTSTPTSFTLNTANYTNGSHTLTARATDTSGNIGSSSNISINFSNDKTLPSVSISSPANGSTVSGTTTVNVNASDNVGISKIEFLVDGTLLANSSSSPATFTLDSVKFSNGTHTLTARATDTSGNQASASVTINVQNVATDTSPPKISILSPLNNSKIGSSSTRIKLSLSDEIGVTKFEFFINGNLAYQYTFTPPTISTNFNLSWSTQNVARGTYTLQAFAYDAKNNKGSSNILNLKK